MKRLLPILFMATILSIITACGAAQPETVTVVETVVVEKEVEVIVVETVEVEVVKEVEVEKIVEVAAEVMPSCPDQTIKWHDGGWQSMWIANAIAMHITEHGYGCAVEQISASTDVAKVALPLGDEHVMMEGWRVNVQEWYDENVANGKIVDLGQIFESATQGWYIPRAVSEEHGITSVEDLLKPEVVALFPDPEDPGKGVWTNCIIGWNCQRIMRAKSKFYGMDEFYNVLEPGAAAGIDASIAGAMERGEPVLSYYWEPTWILGKYDMVQLEEPPYTAECWAEITVAKEEEDYGTLTQACAYETIDIHILIWSGLLDEAPEVTAMLSKMFLGTARVNELGAWMEDNEAEPEDVAVYYLQNFEDDWTTWVPEDVAEKVKASLE